MVWRQIWAVEWFAVSRAEDIRALMECRLRVQQRAERAQDALRVVAGQVELARLKAREATREAKGRWQRGRRGDESGQQSRLRPDDDVGFWERMRAAGLDEEGRAPEQQRRYQEAWGEEEIALGTFLDAWL